MTPPSTVVVSAKGQVVDRVALLRSGADDYPVKPFSPEELPICAGGAR